MGNEDIVKNCPAGFNHGWYLLKKDNYIVCFICQIYDKRIENISQDFIDEALKRRPLSIRKSGNKVIIEPSQVGFSKDPWSCVLDYKRDSL